MAKKVKAKKRRDDEDEDDDDLDEELEELEEEEEEDEDEDDEPVKKKKKKKKPVDDDDEDEDDEDSDDDDDDESDDDDDDEAESNWYSESPEKAGKGDTKNQGDRLQFPTDEPVTIMFLKETPFLYHRHFLGMGKGRGYATCPKPGACPLDKQGNAPSLAGAYYVATYDKKGKPTAGIVIEGTRFGKKYAKQKERRGKLVGVIFEVTKTGSKTETDWDFEFKEKRKASKEELKLIEKAPDFKKMFKPKDLATLKKMAKSFDD